MKITIFNHPLFILLLILITSCDQPPKLRTVTITADQPWQETIAEAGRRLVDDPVDVVIHVEREQQLIDGFGACFNELGWDALQSLDSGDREKILYDFFDPDQGCKFNICRMPIAANDYALSWYSFAETPGDYDMEHFSIERDRQYLIPYIKAAKKYRPDLQIWASPWCPPAWMKTNDHYACRMDEVNDLCCKEKEGQEGVTQFIMDEQHLSAYALYFSRFLEAYDEEGINIFAVQPQNEPNSCQNFPSCIWTASDLATFIGRYLGPKLQQDHPDVDIWYGTIERPYIENIDTVLNDPVAGKYIGGIGFQWAGKGAIGPAHEKYPDMKLMQTESECGDGSNDWDAALYTWELMKHYFNNGANSYMYWNMVLDETGKSHWGWKQNSLITIDRSSGSFEYNPEFYLMKLFSRHIRPGAVKVEASDENVLAFRNPDGEWVVLLENLTGEDEVRTIGIGDRKMEVFLKSGSITASIIPPVS